MIKFHVFVHFRLFILEGKLSFPRAGANSDDALSIATDDTIQSAFDSFLAEEQLLSPVSDVTPLMIPSPPDITPLLQVGCWCSLKRPYTFYMLKSSFFL